MKRVGGSSVRLASGDAISWNDETHFRAVAANVMRRILVDHARGKRRLKRSDGRERTTLDTSILGGSPQRDVLDLDEMLVALEADDARAAQVCQLRVFGGLTIDATARWLELSTATVERDWRFARAWLLARLELDGEPQ